MLIMGITTAIDDHDDFPMPSTRPLRLQRLRWGTERNSGIFGRLTAALPDTFTGLTATSKSLILETWTCSWDRLVPIYRLCRVLRRLEAMCLQEIRTRLSKPAIPNISALRPTLACSHIYRLAAVLLGIPRGTSARKPPDFDLTLSFVHGFH